jgi:hypothetical protein
MTQSKDDTITIDLSDYTMDSNSSFITSSSIDSSYTITSSSIDTVDISNIVYNDNISFDWDNISITPTLWKEALPDVDTVNAMCNDYPALAKAYENFKTVYKLVEQDYKGKQEDDL